MHSSSRYFLGCLGETYNSQLGLLCGCGYSQSAVSHQQEEGGSARVLEGTHLVFGWVAAVIGLLWPASSALAEARTTAGPEDNPSVSTCQLAPLRPCTHMAVLTGGFSIHLGYITKSHSTESAAGVSSPSSINVECQWQYDWPLSFPLDCHLGVEGAWRVLFLGHGPKRWPLRSATSRKLRTCQRLPEHHGTEHSHYRKKVIGSTNQQMGTGL